MKTLIVLTFLVAVTLALPQGKFQFPRKLVHSSQAPVPKRLSVENARPSPPVPVTEPPKKVEEPEEEDLEEEEEVKEVPVQEPVTTRRPIFTARHQVPTEEPVAPKKKAPVRNYVPNEYELEQNRAAKYEFNSNIEDNINDQTQQRTEVRDGLKVTGSYSYSDGYFKRTVHYEADDKGYRIVSMESEPLDGPEIDLNGSASVSNDAHGAQIQYRVQSVPVEGPKAKIIN